jgi:hypothetical protein
VKGTCVVVEGGAEGRAEGVHVWLMVVVVVVGGD